MKRGKDGTRQRREVNAAEENSGSQGDARADEPLRLPLRHKLRSVVVNW